MLKMVNKHQKTVNQMRQKLKNQDTIGGAEIWLAFCLLAFYLLIIVSWVGNIVQLIIASKVATSITLLLVLKIVGIFFPPLGILLGFMGFFGF